MDNIQHRGLMMVLSSPSGAGKTTITRKLLESEPNLSLSISVTTRAPRPKEQTTHDYFFIDIPDFENMVAQNQLLEHAKVYGNYYGTPRAPVEKALAAGKDVLFDIEWRGTQQLAEKAHEDLVSIFILPPSWQELERRLRARNQDNEEEINNRLEKAAGDMSHWAEYDYVIINNDLEESITAVKAILHSERLKRKRQVGLSEFVKSLQEGK